MKITKRYTNDPFDNITIETGDALIIEKIYYKIIIINRQPENIYKNC